MMESGGSLVRDVAGNPLDGDWVNPTGWGDNVGNDTYPSGIGVTGDYFNFKILVLEYGTIIGDTNDDGRVDLDDLDAVRNSFGETGPLGVKRSIIDAGLKGLRRTCRPNSRKQFSMAFNIRGGEL